jgi:uncharacterized membrane protein
MHAKGEIVFKILYPFILSLIPLTLYRICEKQFGKLIGLLSALFLVFTSTAFYGLEPLSLNRQIVGAFFLFISVFILLSKTIPVERRRRLLIVFGAALAVSHYSLAYIYLGIVALVFIISRVKPKFDDTLNTETVLLLFGMTLAWYAIGPSSPLITFTYSIKLTFAELTTPIASASGTASTMFFVPQTFTISTWINLLLSGIANLFLIIGVLAIVLRILRPKGTGISAQYGVIMIIAGIILATSSIAPSLASRLNFTRFYASTLLFLSPCFVLGGQMLLATIGRAWTKIKRLLKRQIPSKNKGIDLGLLLIAIILSGYFLSQVGFVNYVTNGAIHSYSTDFERMITSNNRQVKISLYSVYVPKQDVFSATWLLNNRVDMAEVFADPESGIHVLWSYGVIPYDLLLPITNTTIPTPGSFVYLGTLNIVNGVITATNGTAGTITGLGSFNTSEISLGLDQNNLLYSNGNSEIWNTAPAN